MRINHPINENLSDNGNKNTYLILEALYPKTNNIESITFDLPLPLGPTMLVKLLWKGPNTCLPAY